MNSEEKCNRKICNDCNDDIDRINANIKNRCNKVVVLLKNESLKQSHLDPKELILTECLTLSTVLHAFISVAYPGDRKSQKELLQLVLINKMGFELKD